MTHLYPWSMMTPHGIDAALQLCAHRSRSIGLVRCKHGLHEYLCLDMMFGLLRMHKGMCMDTY